MSSGAFPQPADPRSEDLADGEVVLVGVRSPIVTEYEESCFRSGRRIAAGVSAGGAPRALGIEVLIELAEAAGRLAGKRFLACAFGPDRRRELTELARGLGMIAAPALIDPGATLARSARVGDGSFVNAGAILGALVYLGENVLVNRAASIGHHSVFDDDVSVGPGVTVTGNVRVGRGSVLGAGCTVLPDVRIGEGCVVAAGSVVNRHVSDGTFVAGNPAAPRPFDRLRSSLNPPGGE